jgi:hypothetical protein
MKAPAAIGSASTKAKVRRRGERLIEAASC